MWADRKTFGSAWRCGKWWNGSECGWKKTWKMVQCWKVTGMVGKVGHVWNKRRRIGKDWQKACACMCAFEYLTQECFKFGATRSKQARNSHCIIPKQTRTRWQFFQHLAALFHFFGPFPPPPQRFWTSLPLLQFFDPFLRFPIPVPFLGYPCPFHGAPVALHLNNSYRSLAVKLRHNAFPYVAPCTFSLHGLIRWTGCFLPRFTHFPTGHYQ